VEVWAHLLPGGSWSGEWIAEQPGYHSVMVALLCYARSS